MISDKRQRIFRTDLSDDVGQIVRMAATSPASKKLKALRERSGLTIRGIAELLGGMKHTSYAYYEDDYKEEFLPQKLARQLADVLVGRGEPPIVLAEVYDLAGLEIVTADGPVHLPDQSVTADLPAQLAAAGAWPRDVPIYGVTVGGTDDDSDFFLNVGQIVDHARRPPALTRRNVFALYVQGTSMSPWRASGSLVYLDPVRPAKAGDHVVVECHPNREGEGHPAFLKEFISQTPTKLKLRQYNPDGAADISLAKIRKIYRVIEWEEVLGV